MIPWILAVLALWVVQTFLPAIFKTALAPEPARAMNDHMRAKDNAPVLVGVGARLERARLNMLEALPVFLGVALLLEIHGSTSSLAWGGAALFLVARMLYIPAYVVGIWGVRSGMWTISWIGLAAMIGALFA